MLQVKIMSMHMFLYNKIWYINYYKFLKEWEFLMFKYSYIVFSFIVFSGCFPALYGENIGYVSFSKKLQINTRQTINNISETECDYLNVNRFYKVKESLVRNNVIQMSNVSFTNTLYILPASIPLFCYNISGDQYE